MGLVLDLLLIVFPCSQLTAGPCNSNQAKNSFVFSFRMFRKAILLVFHYFFLQTYSLKSSTLKLKKKKSQFTMMPHSPILIKEILFHNNKDQLCKKAELLKRQYHNNNAQTTTYARPMGFNTQASELQVLRGSW